jgi:hypothetical protein|tara:strand:+ start:320 stop:862 length:543 start_codon:yes stop_codon:yes gene_type:complete
MKFRAILALLMLSIFAVFVSGTMTQTLPAQYSTETSKVINFTFNVTNTANGDTRWNVTVWNKSSSSGAYGLLFYTNLSNSSSLDKGFTMANEDRVWWKVNTTNGTSGVNYNSGVRLFDVDVGYNTITVGAQDKINLSVDVGNITIAGYMNVNKNLSLIDPAGARWLCGINASGRLHCTQA